MGWGKTWTDVLGLQDLRGEARLEHLRDRLQRLAHAPARLEDLPPPRLDHVPVFISIGPLVVDGGQTLAPIVAHCVTTPVHAHTQSSLSGASSKVHEAAWVGVLRRSMVASERAGWSRKGVCEMGVVQRNAGGKEREDIVCPCMRDEGI